MKLLLKKDIRIPNGNDLDIIVEKGSMFSDVSKKGQTIYGSYNTSIPLTGHRRDEIILSSKNKEYFEVIKG